MEQKLLDSLDTHIEVLQSLRSDWIGPISESAKLIADAVGRGNRILLCGNGGSAADCQHIAAELVGRFKRERGALPAIALTTDTSALTAIGNDYGFEEIFRRQVSALALSGDVLVAISTSGNSPNIIAAVESANTKGALVIGLTGAEGGLMRELCDVCLCVPSSVTARIQEAHITIGHLWCEFVDEFIQSEELA